MTRDALRLLIERALTHVTACEALYQGHEAFARFATMIGARYRFINVAYCRAGVFRLGNVSTIVINGTDDDPHDWVCNLQARQRTFQGLCVHSGWAEVAELIALQLRRSNVQELLAGAELYITGHSSGGAVAQLLALVCDPSEVMTFGAPRVISAADAPTYRAYPFDEVRFVHGSDPVPSLPLRRFWHIFGGSEYSHTSDAMYIGSDGTLRLDRSPWLRIGRLAMSAWYASRFMLAIARRRLTACVRDHFISGYVAAIERAWQTLNQEEGYEKPTVA